MTEYQSIFKSPQAEAAYVAAYDRALEKWPVPYESKYVPTAYGETHMIVSGPEDGEPIIVIHGGDIDATYMSPVILGLSPSYRVYALDIIGYAGKSKAVKGIEDRARLAEWLTGVLDALNIEKVYMAGWSLGGFLTVNYALEKPERLKKIVLIAPATTFLPFSKEWHLVGTLTPMLTGLASGVHDARVLGSYVLEGFLGATNITKKEVEEGKDKALAKLMSEFQEESLKELEERIASALKSWWEFVYVPGSLDDETIDQLVQKTMLRVRTHRFPPNPLLAPAALPDEDLEKLNTPTLLIYGDKEVMYDVDQAFKRAEALVENIQTALIPNASHMLIYEQTELVNSHILDFLSGDK